MFGDVHGGFCSLCFTVCLCFAAVSNCSVLEIVQYSAWQGLNRIANWNQSLFCSRWVGQAKWRKRAGAECVQ